MAYFRLSLLTLVLCLIVSVLADIDPENSKSKDAVLESKDAVLKDVQSKGVVGIAASDYDYDDPVVYTVLTPPMTVVVIYGLVFLLFGISWVPWYIGLRQRRTAERRKDGISNKVLSDDAITSTEGTYEITTQM